MTIQTLVTSDTITPENIDIIVKKFNSKNINFSLIFNEKYLNSNDTILEIEDTNKINVIDNSNDTQRIYKITSITLLETFLSEINGN